MNDHVDLRQQEAHFAFGKNWASYANLVTEAEIADAVAGLRRLAGDDLQGKRFLDIGCGSGLHALAALRLGASEVLALDIDPDSVATTRRVLEAHAPNQPWRVLQKSIFDTDSASVGQFDVVYSWGVLHHTGDMYGALRRASTLVAAPNGQFIFALYRHTRLCWFWKIEKRWYAQAGERAQRRARSVYTAAFRIVYSLSNRRTSFRSYVESYPARNRGMEFNHDVHDWMGGWPYESISPRAVDTLMRELGLERVRAFAQEGTPLGLRGSGCDEFAYVRR